MLCRPVHLFEEPKQHCIYIYIHYIYEHLWLSTLEFPSLIPNGHEVEGQFISSASLGAGQLLEARTVPSWLLTRGPRQSWTRTRRRGLAVV